MAYRSPTRRRGRALTTRRQGRPRIGGRMRGDLWVNANTGLGDTKRDPRMGLTFAKGVNLIYHDDLRDNLFRYNALARRIISKAPKLAVSRGLDLVLEDADAQTKAKQELRRLKVLARLAWGRTLARKDGHALLVLNVNQLGGAEEPLNLAGVSELVNLRVIPARRFTVHWDESGGPNDGQPEAYTVYKNNGSSVKIHASRCYRFLGAEIEEDEARAQGGAHDPVLNVVFRQLADLGGGAGTLAQLLQNCVTTVFGIQGLHQAIDDGDADFMAGWVESVMQLWSVFNGLALDAENESVQRLGQPLEGAGELWREVMFMLAAAADMPFTELFGRSPAGLNATGENDTRKWYDKIDSEERGGQLGEALDLVLEVVAAQSSVREFKGVDQIGYTWPSLWSPTEKEGAEIRKLDSETVKNHVESKVLYPQEVAESLFGGQAYTHQIALDRELRKRLEREAGSGPDGDIRGDAFSRAGISAHTLEWRGDGEEGDGSKVGIFLRLPDELARQRPTLPQDGSPAHITLLYIGDVRGREEELLEHVRQACADALPDRGYLEPLDTFLNPQGQMIVFQPARFERRWDGGVDQVRDQLLDRLTGPEGMGVVDVSAHGGWRPHLTRGYFDDSRATVAVNPIFGTWFVGAVEVWGLPQGPVSIPLGPVQPQPQGEPNG